MAVVIIFYIDTVSYTRVSYTYTYRMCYVSVLFASSSIYSDSPFLRARRRDFYGTYFTRIHTYRGRTRSVV